MRFGLWTAVWTIAGLFFFTQDLSRAAYSGDPTPWWRYLISWLLGAWLGAAMTPVVV